MPLSFRAKRRQTSRNLTLGAFDCSRLGGCWGIRSEALFDSLIIDLVGTSPAPLRSIGFKPMAEP